MTTLSLLHKLKLRKTTTKDKIIRFYDEATEDYEFWSKDFNMHFGYYIPFKTNLFKRDSMLNEMNKQVFDRLDVSKKNTIVADLGCGIGGAIRYGLRKYPLLHIIGVTLSSFQVKEGNKRLKKMNGLILEENYMQTSFKTNSIHGAYAIESFCHSGHDTKALQEAYRILKPKARLVIADAFIKKDENKLCLGSSHCYEKLCEGWSLEGLGNIHQIEKKLKQIGFKNVVIEDISFRVAPSVLHVPFAILGFIFQKLCNKENLKPQSWKNLKGSLYALLSGLHIRDFGYYLIIAEK
ncbi:methyltransferase domain-containing protein [Aquimarina sp. AD10]|uniref:methyltransferase domain-containing protein n=1 Tax=Aquimarina sp. AD10 TaxID=1714849 RepID=UPI000E50F215|nr:methyltransferase domain-containing protein [Aquimarina sp. AD10]AXT62889.1 methyltransferase domain-containing protein [Aquimarina sp. AD10]RKM94257.1 methyltransferase domain-containing protein [Aquimarina sp. AD10]